MQYPIEFISAVIILSADHTRLAAFYRDVLGVQIKASAHGDIPHFECDLGDIHFAIYPRPKGLTGGQDCAQKMKVAFAVPNLQAMIDRLAAHGIALEYPPEEKGFATMTAVRDPDENLVELTQLSSNWLSYLRGRSLSQRDMVKRLAEVSASAPE